MNTPKSDSSENTEGWIRINWRKAEKYVFKLQKRIYAASRCGDIKRVRKLQQTLMRSWSNRVLAVRRVTQDNQGKKTAGVDGIKSLSPEARLNLAKIRSDRFRRICSDNGWYTPRRRAFAITS